MIGCPILNCMIHNNACNDKGKYCAILRASGNYCVRLELAHPAIGALERSDMSKIRINLSLKNNELLRFRLLHPPSNINMFSTRLFMTNMVVHGFYKKSR